MARARDIRAQRTAKQATRKDGAQNPPQPVNPKDCRRWSPTPKKGMKQE